jgi:undecaprenyl-diphosphatase
MKVFDAVLYGVIQGVTEFLPVSSSAHLALLPKFGEFIDPGVEFDLMMHLGTAMAIVLYFYKKILGFFKILPVAMFPALRRDELDIETHKDLYLVRNMVVTTIITVLVALCLKTFALRVGRSPNLIAFNLIFFGFLLWLSDKKSLFKVGTLEKEFQFKTCLFLGCLQSLAIFPGVSRSGILLTGTRSLALPKVQASEFTFLLSLPLIFAGVIHKLPAIMLGTSRLAPMFWILGTVVSFVVGIAVIHFFMKFIVKVGFLPFFIYRLVLGVLILSYL